MGILDSILGSRNTNHSDSVLDENNAFTKFLISASAYPIVVLSRDHALLFANQPGEHLLRGDSGIATQLNDCIDCREDEFEITGVRDKGPKTYMVVKHTFCWFHTPAVVFTFVSATAAVMQRDDSSRQDRLTGLYNKPHALHTINEWIGKSQPFTFCILTIDNLKAVNRFYSREHGDEYIQFAATAFSKTFLDAVVCRSFAGEFFVVTRSTREDCIVQIEAAKAELAESIAGHPYYSNISYRLSLYAPDTPLHASDLLQAANDELQRNKLSNRHLFFYEICSIPLWKYDMI